MLNFARELDLGKELDKITENLKDPSGAVYRNVSGDVWNI